MSAIVSIVIVCDACGRKLPTSRTKVAGARGDADRAGWRVSETGDGYRRAGLSEDRARRDECPWCRTDRPAPDAKPDGALL